MTEWLNRLRTRNGVPRPQSLVESHQELCDGSVRHRNQQLSEKLNSGEDINSTAEHAIMEELSSIFPDSVNYSEIVKILPDSYEKKIEQRDSISYSGLPGCYVMHTMDALMDGLPDEEFVTEEGNEYEQCKSLAMEAISVRKHFWKWIPRDSL